MSTKKSTVYPVILTQNFLTLIADREFSITKSDPRFPQAIELYRKRDYNGLLNLLDRVGAIQRYSHGAVCVYDNAVTYNGTEVHGVIAMRILDFLKQGLPFEPLARFLDRLYKNVSEGVRSKLFSFLEHNHLAITEDGFITAFKLVDKDGRAPYNKTGHFFETRNGKHCKTQIYRVGYEYTYPRNEIREGEQECGTVGLYVANKNYWNGDFDQNNVYTGRGRLLIAQIDPQDVCNVAHAESSKMVACRMRLVGEYKTLQSAVSQPLVKRSQFGLKPSGQRFHNVRGTNGKFVKSK